MTKQGTLHLTYWREYYDSEEYGYDAYFKIHHTIFRNVPLSQLNRLNSKELKDRFKKYCDKNYEETASNFTGESGVDMIHGSDYYYTYGEAYELQEDDRDYNSLFHDYGQKYNGRKFFKYDFDPNLTKQLTRGYYDN